MENEILVGYGIGQFFDYVKDKLPFTLSFLCDRRWKEFNGVYKGIPVISPEKIKDLGNVRVIIFGSNDRVCSSIESDLKSYGIVCERVWKYIKIPYEISGKELKKMRPGGGTYQDQYQNTVYYDKSIDDRIKIIFKGGNNKLMLGKEISVGSVEIIFGNKGICEIGSCSEIVSGFICVSNGMVKIGEECLLSNDIGIRCHDGHHIFRTDTRRRVNYSKDVIIGDHVWIGARACLLPGFSIQSNSIVGAESVSSSQFGKELIIAGNPARVIRTDIFWTKADTDFYQYDNFSECMDNSVEKYLG